MVDTTQIFDLTIELIVYQNEYESLYHLKNLYDKLFLIREMSVLHDFIQTMRCECNGCQQKFKELDQINYQKEPMKYKETAYRIFNDNYTKLLQKKTN